MKKPPTIIMQLVHIQGPMKGQIQEFSSETISIGRHSSCDVLFPKDLDIISRKHARIIREGNRFKLLDQSTNGTFLNGKQVQEAYLKDGDILLFADSGPKVSFLTKLGESQADSAPVDQIPPTQKEPPQPYQPQAPAKPLSTGRETPSAEMKVEKSKMPLIIQYGPTIRTFKELPVMVGRNPACDFSIDHAGLLDQHVQFFFSQGKYGIKDLTGQNQVTLNGSPIGSQAELHPESLVSLSSSGPRFRFLGAGRLAEIEETPQQAENIPSPAPAAPSVPENKTSEPQKGAKRLLGKLFKP